MTPWILAYTLLLAPLVDKDASAIKVTNLRDAETIRFPVALVKGIAPGQVINVVNQENRRSGGTNAASIADGRFKVLVELVPGRNRLQFTTTRKDKASFSLVYKPMISDYKVDVVYLTAQDGDTQYATQKADDKQNYLDKLDTAAKLMQTFTAESLNDSGFGRRTFGLNYDSRGRVRVLKLAYPASGDQLRGMTGNQLYDAIYPWLDRQVSFQKRKCIVIMSFSRYDAKSKRPLAHIAWGGGDMGLFSSLSMSAWPSSIRDVARAFGDSSPINPEKLYDDSFGRSTLWGLASTGMGAVLHELGHTFVGAEHSADPKSVMSRGFDHFNRFFVAKEAPSAQSKTAVTPKPGEVMRWDAYNASLLACDRFFQPDAREFKNDSPPRIYLDWATDEVVGVAPHGVKLVHFWNQTDPPSHTTYKIFQNSPKVVRIKRSLLRQLVKAPDGAAMHLTDAEGQVFSVNERAFTGADDLPPITSKEYLAELRNFVAGLTSGMTYDWADGR